GGRSDGTLALVGRRAVDRRDRYLIEPQVDAELTAVVDRLAEDKAAERGEARHREHVLSAPLERPWRHVFRIALVHQSAGLLRGVVKQRENLGARRLRRLVRRRGCEIERRLIQDGA